jgi:phage shock protein PspC (stress-responsive transcriptional regulator)
MSDISTDNTTDEPITAADTVLPTGLRRSNQQRVIAGVAGGVAERFDSDANVIRVVFVVLSFLFGLGVAIYLAMWVLIPRSKIERIDDADEPVVPRPKLRWIRYSLLIATLVLGIMVIAAVTGAPRFGRNVAVLWLLYLFGLAILSLFVSRREFGLGRVFALLFLVAVTFVIAVTGALMGFLASTGVPLSGGMGQKVWQPQSLAQVQHDYRVEFGTSTVNLASVQFPRAGFEVTTTVASGRLTIDVPKDAVVNLKTHIGIGGVTYQLANGWESEGFDPNPPTATPAKASPHLTIDAQVGIGSIQIVR